MDGWRERGSDASTVDESAAGQCPACGPVAAAVTSRYCARHLAELRARWGAIRAPSLPARAA